MNFDLSPLTRFIAKCDIVANGLDEAYAHKLAEKGAERIAVGYKDSTQEIIDEGNKVTLFVSGSGLAYREYGTGKRGEGTYPGELPVGPWVFDSRGQHWSISPWEYMYHPQTKKNGYWMWGGVKCYGQPAKAEMWYTRQSLEGDAEEILNEVFNEVMSNVS